MSNAYDDARRLRQEVGDLWPRLKLAESRLAEAERVLEFVRDHGDGCDLCCELIDAFLAGGRP